MAHNENVTKRPTLRVLCLQMSYVSPSFSICALSGSSVLTVLFSPAFPFIFLLDFSVLNFMQTDGSDNEGRSREIFICEPRRVSKDVGEAARPVHQPAAEWMIPGHSSAPLLSPRWYFSAAKCHINIHCRLINLSSHGTWWHLTSCWNTDGSAAEPLLLTHICPECSHCTAPVFNTAQPHASFFLL